MFDIEFSLPKKYFAFKCPDKAFIRHTATEINIFLTSDTFENYPVNFTSNSC